jgi:hypothetical protein
MLEESLKDERLELLTKLEQISQSRDTEKLEKITRTMLRENMNDPAALFYMAKAHIYNNQEEIGATLLQKCAALKPNSAHIYELMGSAFDGMYMYEEAIACYEKAIELEEANDKERTTDEKRSLSALYGSIASSYVGISKPYIAIEYCNKGLEYDSKSKICRANKGIANMEIGNWSEGWQGYELLVGEPGTKRKLINYGGADSQQRWDGSKVECLVTYAEQGIGDSIMFASCIEDAQKKAKKIVIDCDKKLEGLFKRSFPDCDVYGTRHDPNPDWTKNYQVDASLGMGSLPSLFRLSKESFPKNPYLIADPERRLMYRALLGSWSDRPKVGISWTGGNIYGGFRRLELDRLQKLVESFPNIDWVGLQYKATPTYNLPIHKIPYASESNDYDDTAALIDELDLVISVPQAAVHLAGALGKECWCLVPDQVRWIYGIEGSEHQWYGSVKLYRDWESEIDQVIHDLSLRYPHG